MHLRKDEWEPVAGKPEFFDQVALALRTDGYVLLESVFGAEKIAGLYGNFSELLDRYRENHESNRGRNRYNLSLPAREPFVDAEVITNEVVFPLISRILGDDLAVSFLAADTPLEGSDYQFAHSDGRMLFPGLGVALPAYCIVMNIMLVDFTAENGPLEIWPNGSHLFDGAEAVVGTQHRAAQQVIAPAGSVVIRDARMWHRGTPNRTPNMRPMMAVVFSKSWYRFGEAEVGLLPSEVDAATYEAFGPDMKRLFRFANVENGLNSPVVLETLTTRVPPPAAVL